MAKRQCTDCKEMVDTKEAVCKCGNSMTVKKATAKKVRVKRIK